MTGSGQCRDWILMALAVVFLLGAVATKSTQAQTLTVIHDFTGDPDGAYPYAGLVRDAAGNVYGTTNGGGSSSLGSVFKVSPTGKETVLHSFAGDSDGEYPFAGVIIDAKGNLYGTTYYGGTFDYGTLYKVSRTGKETVLYNFAGGSSDGCYPAGGLLRAEEGTFYGTTVECGTSGFGTVFKVDSGGTEAVLHSFAGGSSDGAYPSAGVIMDTKGNLYGYTYEGGSGLCTNGSGDGCGVVYKLNKTKTLTVLHSFTGGTTDGRYPYLGTPAMDTKGNLYGTTQEGGSSGLGVVWKVSKKGTEAVLHSFAGGPSDGAGPYAGVIIDAKGSLYGATSEGGFSNYGTVYKLSKKDTLALLHSFTGSDGENTFSGLVLGAKGDLYGTAEAGGSCCGTVWKLTP